MNKSLLTIGILLSLSTAGCAGMGVQHGSSLHASVQQEPGLDSLWLARKKAPVQGLEAPAYAEQALGGLWDAREAPVSTPGTTRSFADRGLENLWTSWF
jgi:hypothetical protein